MQECELTGLSPALYGQVIKVPDGGFFAPLFTAAWREQYLRPGTAARPFLQRPHLQRQHLPAMVRPTRPLFLRGRYGELLAGLPARRNGPSSTQPRPLSVQSGRMPAGCYSTSRNVSASSGPQTPVPAASIWKTMLLMTPARLPMATRECWPTDISSGDMTRPVFTKNAS